MPYHISQLSSSAKETHGSQRAPIIKARQLTKIHDIALALTSAGITGLDDQAFALGLSRSTAWSILASQHKWVGISAATIERMLASPALPRSVRSVIIEYVEEKAAGLYGHNYAQRARFVARLAAKLTARQLFANDPLLQPALTQKKEQSAEQ